MGDQGTEGAVSSGGSACGALDRMEDALYPPEL